MSSKIASSTHERLKTHIEPIHLEIGKLTQEIERMRGERAILQAMAINELTEAGFSKEAVSGLSAACW